MEYHGQISIVNSKVYIGDNYGGSSAEHPVPPSRAGAPYRGLDSFQTQDADIFFGRDAETEKVWRRLGERLTEPGLLMISGASGTGKSSLLRAGLMARLHAEGLPDLPAARTWPVAAFEPTAPPLESLLTRVTNINDPFPLARELTREPEGFAVLLRKAVRDQLRGTACEETGRYVLVIDQFERVFTDFDEAQRRALIGVLHAASIPQERGQIAPALIVLGIRQDFEERCMGYKGLVDAVQRRYVLPRMEEGQLLSVITEPARKAGITIDDGLLYQLQDDMKEHGADGESGSGGLPLLSYALFQTWREHSGETLTLSDYQKTGGISQVVQRKAEAAYASLDARHQLVAQRIFVMLTAVTADGKIVSRARSRAELAKAITEGQADAVDEVLNLFAHRDTRLLTLSAANAAIAHESLIRNWPVLREKWLHDDLETRKEIGKIEVAAAEWVENEREPDLLFSGSKLDGARKAQEAVDAEPGRFPGALGPAERDFVRAGERQEKFESWLLWSVVGVLIILLGASGVFWVQEHREKDAALQKGRELSQAKNMFRRERNAAVREEDTAEGETLDVRVEQTGHFRQCARDPDDFERELAHVTCLPKSSSIMVTASSFWIDRNDAIPYYGDGSVVSPHLNAYLSGDLRVPASPDQDVICAPVSVGSCLQPGYSGYWGNPETGANNGRLYCYQRSGKYFVVWTFDNDEYEAASNEDFVVVASSTNLQALIQWWGTVPV